MSLQETSAWPFPLLVVDNGSGTGEGQRLADEFGPPVTVTTLDEDGGVPSGYNEGIAWAAHLGVDFVLLLNNDVVASDPALIGRLLEAATPDCAAVGPIVRNPAGEVWSAGGLLRAGTSRASHMTYPLSRERPYEADWLDGSCILISVAAATEIGGLEPDYFLYWEELDWCTRARTAGRTCLVQPMASITHLGSVSVTGALKMRYWLRNRLLFTRRNGTARDNVATLVAFFVRTVPHLLVTQGLSPRGWALVMKSAGTALGWNLADAVRRGAWRRPADGPSIGR